LIKRAILSTKIRWSEYPLTLLEDSLVTDDDTWAIPNVCYQTWIDRYFGKSHFSEIKDFRSLNQDVSWILFDETAMNDYMKSNWGGHAIYNIFSASNFGPMKADIFRYCIIFDRGGYYFDVSKSCKIPLRSMHGKFDQAFISFEKNVCITLPDKEAANKLDFPLNLVIQWGFGFTAKHPLLLGVIESICENAFLFRNVRFQSPKDAILAFTGPGMFTESVRNFAKQNDLSLVAQCDTDFMGSGVYALNGSYVRNIGRKHYTEFDNQIILN